MTTKKKKTVAAPKSAIAAKDTKVTEVTPTKHETPPENEEWPLRKKDLFLFIKGGNRVYYTRSTANVLFARNADDIEIPKGSEYVPPKGSKCKGCGNG